MPPLGYLSSDDIEQGIVHLNSTFPSFTQVLPFGSSEQSRPIRALRIRSGGGERNGALLIGGTHARELINPDLLLMLAFNICSAYENDLGLTFGGKSWSNIDVRAVVAGLDIFIVPNINPDGREVVLKPVHEGGDRMWRKNCGTNADGTIGADLARNCDFLWRWAIGGIYTSSDPTSQQYKGDMVFSERETRNVREFLNAHPHIACFVDVHSFAEAIIYPWGDDENQSADPSMSFRNQVWDGLRGHRGDTYKEYIPEADEAKYKARAGRMREAIRAVRNRQYRVLQVVELYLGVGVSGSPMDYAYSRFFTGPRGKVWAYTIETNRGQAGDDYYGFQPPYADALLVMKEVQSGLIQFLLSCVCIVREIGKRRVKDEILDDLRVFRDDEMIKSRRGRRFVELLDTHSDELLTLFAGDERARESAEEIVAQASEIVHGRERDEPPTVDRQLAARIDRLAARLEKKASPELRKGLAVVRKEARALAGKSARQAIR